jgi:DnaJ-class molecular chaperone
LDIHLEFAHGRAQQTGAEINRQPLREYYLDWQHFSGTTKEDVQALLEGVWQQYISGDEQEKAYQTLGLEEGVSLSLIRKSYRKLAGRYHPDKGGDSLRFMEIRQAYEVLKKSRS